MLWQRALFPNLFLAYGVAIPWMARAESISLAAKADTGLQEFRPTTCAGSSQREQTNGKAAVAIHISSA